jgi:APA family basic amino acid/polyamine antiporter
MVVNMLGTRKGGQVQNVTTYIKAGFLAAIALLPFVMGRAEVANWTSTLPAPASGSLLTAFGAAMIAALWAYDGWGNLTPVAEEVENPQRTIPRALLMGVFIVTALYVTANVAYHAVLPMDEMTKTSNANAAATMLDRLLGSVGRDTIAAVIMCSTFGGVNANLLVGPRVFFAMSRDGMFFPPLSNVHTRYQTPANAILLQGVWAMVLLTAGGLFKSGKELKDLFDTLTDFVIFGASIFYTMAVAAVFVLRRKFPDKPRPYRAWGYPVVPIVFVLTYVWLLTTTLYGAPVRSAIGLAVIALGIPVFWYWERRRRGRHDP